jgi:Tol biopolymer transport system component
MLAPVRGALAAREPVLKQIDLPHSYYFREMFLPQLTSGPSGVDFSPDGQELIYSMAGSLWRQRIGEDVAVELTHGPGYDYQPDWSPDGRSVVFTRHLNNAIELWRLDLPTITAQQLTKTNAVNVQPRYSPGGRQIAYVSTAGSGHFNLFVAAVDAAGLGPARAVIAPRESEISRYYYSTHDHTINPSWTPDGERIVFVSNRETAYGTGNLCMVALADPAATKCFLSEETSWRANPEVAPDGRRVLYSSYQGRQWHQLWLTTLTGDATLPLTFGEFDVTQARWSPDGRRVVYISNETGNLSLWLRDVVGGERKRVEARERRYRRPMHAITLSATNPQGRSMPARFSVLGADDRAYAPSDAWVSADDGFDPLRQREETHYFHCASSCTLLLPEGDARITAWRGHEYEPVQRSVRVNAATTAALSLQPLTLPNWAPSVTTADMHVHMNYGGHYRHTTESLARQALAEDLDVVYNTIVNKEQRIPDIGEFRAGPHVEYGVTIQPAQEYHTSFWGHLGLLYLDDHFLTPDFSAYQHSALTSPYPHNGAVADLAHRQNALVGYVHPYDWAIQPDKEKSLTHALPADVALGKADYLEVVGFSDHKATAAVWHGLLNLGFRVPAGAGTDAMANYASLRGPIGMNRVYLHSKDPTPDALRAALKEGRSVASNGPQLAFQLEASNIGDTMRLPAGEHRLRFRAALRSPVPIDHLEVVHNGRVVAAHRFGKDRKRVDFDGAVTVRDSGWIVLRAWNDEAHPLIFDLYPYATTSPIYLEVAGRPVRSAKDAAYFVRWMDRVIAAAEARDDYNNEAEKKDTLAYLHAAREVFVGKVQLGRTEETGVPAKDRKKEAE